MGAPCRCWHLQILAQIGADGYAEVFLNLCPEGPGSGNKKAPPSIDGGAFRCSKSVVSRLLLKDYVNFPTRLQHFPCPAKPCRDDKTIARPESLGATFMITKNGNALHDFAIFVLGVIDRPLAHSTFPHPGTHLPARAVVVVVDNLFGGALEHFFRCRAEAVSLGVGSAEIDDGCDAHGSCPPEIAVYVVRKPKSMFIKTNKPCRLRHSCQIY